MIFLIYVNKKLEICYERSLFLKICRKILPNRQFGSIMFNQRF